MRELEQALLPQSKKGTRVRRHKRQAGAPRGDFASATYGHSYGGGQQVSFDVLPASKCLAQQILPLQKPASFTQSDRKRQAWTDFLGNKDMKELLDFIKSKYLSPSTLLSAKSDRAHA